MTDHADLIRDLRHIDSGGVSHAKAPRAPHPICEKAADMIAGLVAERSSDWFAGSVDCDGNELATLPATELQKLRDERDKFMWQVRDTCARAEKAEAELAATREALAVTMQALREIAAGALPCTTSLRALATLAKGTTDATGK